jgi:hypothetical protein
MAKRKRTPADEGIEAAREEARTAVGKHYINVTTVDANGGASQGQILANEVSEAKAYLRMRVNEATAQAERNTWSALLIAAYIFDTETKTLYRYKVINRGEGLPALIVEEDAQ